MRGDKKVVKELINYLINGGEIPLILKKITDLSYLADVAEEFKDTLSMYNIVFDDVNDFTEFSLSFYYDNDKSHLISFSYTNNLTEVFELEYHNIYDIVDLHDFAEILNRPKNQHLRDYIYGEVFEIINENSWESTHRYNAKDLLYPSNYHNFKEALSNSDLSKEDQVKVYNLITEENYADDEVSEIIPLWEDVKSQVKSDFYSMMEQEKYFKEDTYSSLRNFDRLYEDGVVKYYTSGRKKTNSPFNNFRLEDEIPPKRLCEWFIDSDRRYNKFLLNDKITIFGY